MGRTDTMPTPNLPTWCVVPISSREQRIGRVFLLHGAAVRSAHQTYWSNHPKAVCILELHREKLDKFMEGVSLMAKFPHFQGWGDGLYA